MQNECKGGMYRSRIFLYVKPKKMLEINEAVAKGGVGGFLAKGRLLPPPGGGRRPGGGRQFPVGGGHSAACPVVVELATAQLLDQRLSRFSAHGFPGHGSLLPLPFPNQSSTHNPPTYL